MEKTKQYSWFEMKEIMQKFNDDTGENSTLTAIAVISEDSFDTTYSLTERSYRFTNHNNGLIAGKISNSIIGDCLDGKDLSVRLDYYIPAFWRVEYCYLEECGDATK